MTQIDTDGSVLIVNLARQIVRGQETNPHLRAVKAQLEFAVEIYLGVLELVVKENGIAAEALTRTLFETVVNANILAKNRDKLSDFINHGKLTHLRVLRSGRPPGKLGQMRESVVKSTEPEYKRLCEYFRADGKRDRTSDWHRLKKKASFVAAGLTEALYDKYYRRASPIAHAEPYVVVGRSDGDWNKWRVEARRAEWKRYTISAYVQSSYLMLHLLDTVSKVFGFKFDTEIAAAMTKVKAISTLHIDAIVRAAEKS